MYKASEVTLVCSECGSSFKAELPSLYQHCDPQREIKSSYLICSWCGHELSKLTLAYCDDCFSSQRNEVSRVNSNYQNIIDEVQSKLLSIELEKSNIIASLQRKANELESRVH